jgi:phosphoglycerate dehydrogenase-like enzyme
MKPRVVVAVTESEYAKSPDVFDAAVGFECRRAPGPEPELSRAIRTMRARHAIVGVERYSGLLYDALATGSVVARYGVGFDGLDLPLATRKGILCTNTPGVLDQSVAEHAIALILAAARSLGRMGGWNPVMGMELRGKTLAVIGCGPIGRRTAEIAGGGFGMRVVGLRVTGEKREALKTGHTFSAMAGSFDEAVAEAHFVSLHMRSTVETSGYVNAARLNRMRPEAWLINTARGALVDEAALFDAIRSGRIRGAALDVFRGEPYQPVESDKDLRTLSNVIMTPHVGSSTVEACRRAAERALRNVALGEDRDFKAMDILIPKVLEK